MNAQLLLQEHRAEILHIAKSHGARSIQVFGSARLPNANAHDIDFLVDLADDRSLLDQVAMQQELEQLLGIPVDVVLVGGLSPHLEAQITAEAMAL
jgi:uncharacterized protein